MHPSDQPSSRSSIHLLRRRWLVLACSAALPLAAFATPSSERPDAGKVNETATMSAVDANAGDKEPHS